MQVNPAHVPEAYLGQLRHATVADSLYQSILKKGFNVLSVVYFSPTAESEDERKAEIKSIVAAAKKGNGVVPQNWFETHPNWTVVDGSHRMMAISRINTHVRRENPILVHCAILNCQNRIELLGLGAELNNVTQTFVATSFVDVSNAIIHMLLAGMSWPQIEQLYVHPLPAHFRQTRPYISDNLWRTMEAMDELVKSRSTRAQDVYHLKLHQLTASEVGVFWKQQCKFKAQQEPLPSSRIGYNHALCEPHQVFKFLQNETAAFVYISFLHYAMAKYHHPSEMHLPVKRVDGKTLRRYALLAPKVGYAYAYLFLRGRSENDAEAASAAQMLIAFGSQYPYEAIFTEFDREKEAPFSNDAALSYPPVCRRLPSAPSSSRSSNSASTSASSSSASSSSSSSSSTSAEAASSSSAAALSTSAASTSAMSSSSTSSHASTAAMSSDTVASSTVSSVSSSSAESFDVEGEQEGNPDVVTVGQGGEKFPMDDGKLAEMVQAFKKNMYSVCEEKNACTKENNLLAGLEAYKAAKVNKKAPKREYVDCILCSPPWGVIKAKPEADFDVALTGDQLDLWALNCSRVLALDGFMALHIHVNKYHMFERALESVGILPLDREIAMIYTISSGKRSATLSQTSSEKVKQRFPESEEETQDKKGVVRQNPQKFHDNFYIFRKKGAGPCKRLFSCHTVLRKESKEIVLLKNVDSNTERPRAYFRRSQLSLSMVSTLLLHLLGDEVKATPFLVMDPFSGAGTTAAAAASIGCDFIGFDTDPFAICAHNYRMKSIQGDSSGRGDKVNRVFLKHPAMATLEKTLVQEARALKKKAKKERLLDVVEQKSSSTPRKRRRRKTEAKAKKDENAEESEESAESKEEGKEEKETKSGKQKGVRKPAKKRKVEIEAEEAGKKKRKTAARKSQVEAEGEEGVEIGSDETASDEDDEEEDISDAEFLATQGEPQTAKAAAASAAFHQEQVDRDQNEVLKSFGPSMTAAVESVEKAEKKESQEEEKEEEEEKEDEKDEGKEVHVGDVVTRTKKKAKRS